MEITNEIKAKVFSPYVGCECEYKWNREDEMLHGKITPKIFESLWNDDGVITHCVAKLKPLYEISDEDAIHVGEINGFNKSNGYVGPEAGKDIVLFISENERIHNCNYGLSLGEINQSCQFLQSRGYDLPHYLLGGKTLQECELAIYEPIK